MQSCKRNSLNLIPHAPKSQWSTTKDLVTIARPCGSGAAAIEVEMESNNCKDADEKKKSWKGAMPTISLSIISFDECIEESYRKTLMH